MINVLRRWFGSSTITFDPDWEPILLEQFAHWSALDDAELHRMRYLLSRFVHDTSWEAARGMDLTDDVKVIIAAQASLLLLGLEIDEYFDVSSVIVHKSTVRLSGAHRTAGGTMSDSPQRLAGQATPKGPVVLSWNAVRRGARRPEHGQNVVYHEFAHRLDMLDGITDGTPPLGSESASRRWSEVFTPAFERVSSGDSVLRSYAATNTAEFFAVATEVFFNRPHDLVTHEPEIYEQLRGFYHQDPASRLSAPDR
ncbi:M90 family metallopeptidase [Ilumatobacter nonamiensis]|uniref:M90 family metallopeptidase n=1 Tax=Ilumatobacter nonamiensis TaxID=467093 RepID=UPI0006878DC0|nr:M90 family metallopeptidase [Ilumatobacter nonamiensis]